tara:strand:- start:27 stop:170 length:144 start_codon:yes stop_codon:yes gene_type:complete
MLAAEGDNKDTKMTITKIKIYITKLVEGDNKDIKMTITKITIYISQS